MLSKADKYMKESIMGILNNGYVDKNPRPHYADGTPANTKSVNHVIHTYDISKNEFPITSLRPIYFKKAIGEILWIYQKESNDLNVLKDKFGVTWWDSWDIGDRTVGCCYGETVRRHSLMKNLLEDIKNDPYGRRHIINLWQEDDFKNPHGLKPCCYQVQFNVRLDKIDMILYQRSSDWLTAGNINQMQYVAFMMMVARHCGYAPGVFTHVIGNQQIYGRHTDNANEMLSRVKTLEDRNDEFPLLAQPILKLNTLKTDFYTFDVSDFTIENYDPIKPQLSFEVAI